MVIMGDVVGWCDLLRNSGCSHRYRANRECRAGIHHSKSDHVAQRNHHIVCSQLRAYPKTPERLNVM